MATTKMNPIFLAFLLSFVLGISISQSSVPIAPGLSHTFYESSCPDLEIIVRSHLWKVLDDDITQAAGLLRLHFHDCFVQGCEASVLLDGSTSGPSERDAPPNLTLRKESFKIINDLHALVRSACGLVVSCADIVALAARESVFLPSGPYYTVPLGRRDSVSFATREEILANLPPPFFNTTQLLDAFAAKNLSPIDLVALSGGHTIGRAQCGSFTNRLYPTQDPTMDNAFAKSLKLTCPTSNTDNTTDLDIITPNSFDNKYYVDLVNRKGLLTSDQVLYTDSRTRNIVKRFANDQEFFFEKFVEGMIKMGQLGVLTGTQGEIRTNCSIRNGDNVELSSKAEEDQNVEILLSQF